MFRIGERVRLTQDIDMFGDITAKAGAEATVTRVFLLRDGITISHYNLDIMRYGVFEDELELAEPLTLENE